MVRFRSSRYIFIHLLIIADVMRINSRAVSFSAYNRDGNDTRQAPYTIAIFKGEHEIPSHTIAVFKPQIPSYTVAAIKPFVDQTNLFAHDPLIYKPFLQPDQFALVGHNESHEGEVFENDFSQPEADVANQYYPHYPLDTNQELVGNLTDDPYSYFPVNEEVTGDSNFTGYPAAMPPVKNFTGYPNAVHTTPYPVLLTTDLLDLVAPQQQNTQIAMTKDKLYALYHFGYKFWYGMLLFVVYHAVIVIVFYLSKLAKHYLQFPAALQAAAASDWN